MNCPNLEDEGSYFFRNLRNNLPSSAGTLPRWTASLISGCVYCFKLWQTLTKRSSGTLYGSDFPSFKLALRLTSLKDLKRLRICCAKYTPAKKMAWKKLYIYRVSQEECARIRESVPYVKVYRYNPKHLYPKLDGYGDNDQRSLKLWQLLHTYWLPNTY